MALLYSEDTEILIGCLMNVHNDIGPGLAESIYQEGCETEFSSKAISFESQVSNWVIHRGAMVKELVPDFVIDNKIVLDLKAIFGSFPPSAYTQIINYCKFSVVNAGQFARTHCFKLSHRYSKSCSPSMVSVTRTKYTQES